MDINVNEVNFEAKLMNHYAEPNSREKIEELHSAITNMIKGNKDLLNATLAEVSNKIIAKDLKLSDLISDNRNSNLNF